MGPCTPTLRAAALAAVVVSASAVRNMKTQDASRVATEQQLRKGRFTSDVMLRLEGSINPGLEAQQLHLALTGDATQMSLVYVTMDACNGTIQYWPAQGGPPSWVSTVETSYTAGLFGWNGTIHTGVMTGLQPGTPYTYVAGCVTPTGALWSPQRNFTSAPQPSADAESFIAVTADQGTIVPLGWLVADRMAEEHLMSGRPFDMVMIAGDLSYATLDPLSGTGIEIEWTWDAFCLQNEPFASTAPYMTTVGNHEDISGFLINNTGTYPSGYAAYTARFNMPSASSGGVQNLWYSYDFKNIHFASISSEHNYTVGSQQWQWLQSDLAAANANRNVTPWIIVVLHRPVLSVDADEYSSHVPGGPLSAALEPLFRRFSVDLVITGHEHEYERTYPVFNGTVTSYPNANGTFTNPGAPIYVVQGASGAMQEETFVSPIPAWSATHMQGIWGFGRMTTTAASSLYYEFVDTNGYVQDAFKIVRTSVDAGVTGQ